MKRSGPPLRASRAPRCAAWGLAWALPLAAVTLAAEGAVGASPRAGEEIPAAQPSRASVGEGAPEPSTSSGEASQPRPEPGAPLPHQATAAAPPSSSASGLGSFARWLAVGALLDATPKASAGAAPRLELASLALVELGLRQESAGLVAGGALLLEGWAANVQGGASQLVDGGSWLGLSRAHLGPRDWALGLTLWPLDAAPLGLGTVPELRWGGEAARAPSQTPRGPGARLDLTLGPAALALAARAWPTARDGAALDLFAILAVQGEQLTVSAALGRLGAPSAGPEVAAAGSPTASLGGAACVTWTERSRAGGAALADAIAALAAVPDPARGASETEMLLAPGWQAQGEVVSELPGGGSGGVSQAGPLAGQALRLALDRSAEAWAAGAEVLVLGGGHLLARGARGASEAPTLLPAELPLNPALTARLAVAVRLGAGADAPLALALGEVSRVAFASVGARAAVIGRDGELALTNLEVARAVGMRAVLGLRWEPAALGAFSAAALLDAHDRAPGDGQSVGEETRGAGFALDGWLRVALAFP